MVCAVCLSVYNGGIAHTHIAGHADSRVENEY